MDFFAGRSKVNGLLARAKGKASNDPQKPSQGHTELADLLRRPRITVPISGSTA
jgi:hypothetical protein